MAPKKDKESKKDFNKMEKKEKESTKDNSAGEMNEKNKRRQSSRLSEKAKFTIAKPSDAEEASTSSTIVKRRSTIKSAHPSSLSKLEPIDDSDVGKKQSIINSSDGHEIGHIHKKKDEEGNVGKEMTASFRGEKPSKKPDDANKENEAATVDEETTVDKGLEITLDDEEEEKEVGITLKEIEEVLLEGLRLVSLLRKKQKELEIPRLHRQVHHSLYSEAAYSAFGNQEQVHQIPGYQCSTDLTAGIQAVLLQAQGVQGIGPQSQIYQGPGYQGPGYQGPGYQAPGYQAPGYQRRI